MHIKQIIIQNFQSYKYESVDDFSRFANLILGKNGHGKSNLINAVLFVLTNKYPLGRDEERRAILNNGANPEHDIISVELRFDNKDRKIPIEEDIISLKRVVNPDNKSEHRLQDRAITKQELDNLLSCVGLSRTNPYNIIQQGKIAKIAQMNEKELYNLLQEIIGSNQYEAKKAEALKNLEETDREKAKAKDYLKELKKHVEELQGEKEIFEEYEHTEGQARCIEFCIYQRHLTEIKEKLDSLENSYKDTLPNFTNLKTSDIKFLSYIDELKTRIQDLQLQQQALQTRESSLKDDLRDLHLSRDKLLLEIQELESGKPTSQKGSARRLSTQEAEKSLEDLNKTLIIVNKAIAEHELTLRGSKDTLRGLSKKLDTVYLNKGAKTFASTKEKKAYYEKSISEYKAKIDAARQQVKETEEVITNNKKTLTAHNARIKELEETLKTKNAQFEEISSNTEKTKADKARMAEELKRLIYQSNQDAVTLEEKRKALKKHERNLELAMKDNLLYTLENIQKHVKARNIQGVHGLLIDLIEIPKEFYHCCEVSLKNKLYGFVVDDHKIADTLLAINKEIKGSTINIYPLSWIQELKPKRTEYPSTNGALVVKNLINPKAGVTVDIAPLIDHVFGKLLLVRDYQLATSLAKRYNLNCVTTDGEVVYAGSYLAKLGFFDARNERISIYVAYKNLKDTIETLELNISKNEQAKDKLSSEEIRYIQALQDLSIKRAQLGQQLSNIRGELKSLSDHNLVLDKVDLEHQGFIVIYEDEINKLKDQIEVYEAEANDPQLTKQIELSSDDLKEIEKINSDVAKAKEVLRKHQTEFMQAQNKQREVLTDIEKAKQALREAKNSGEKELESFRRELTSVKTSIENKDAALENIKTERELVAAEITSLEDDIKKTHEQKGISLKEKNQVDEKLTQLNFKRSEYQELKELYSNKLNVMDHVKTEMMSQFRSKTVKELLTQLDNLRRDKKKFTAKDKAIFERLDALEEKIVTYTERIAELEKNEEQTHNLIQTFDSNTQERISKVFKNFNTHFQQFFSQITQGGKAEAKLLKEKPKGRGKTEGKYFAMTISVNFHSSETDKENERANQISEDKEEGWSTMSSLSSGQKTVVTIALIFALQRCDPAPFYFLDEFDAALDSTFRRNIAHVIHENSRFSQYFITTFKNDLIYLRNVKFYEVHYQELVSKVNVIEQARAKELIALIGSDAKPADELV